MDIKKYIERAEEKAGTQKKLAEMLGITTSYLRNVKSYKSGLPDALCIKIADFINADRLEVIAASGLVTEKDSERRKILESCFNRAATVAVAASLIGVTSIVTPSPANANILADVNDGRVYIM